MDTAREPLNWQDSSSVTFLNPRWSQSERQILSHLSKKFERKGHVWVASSGSSRSRDESVKLIALSKGAFLSSAAAVNQHLQATALDVWAQVLPRFHVGGLGIEARAYLSGARVVTRFLNEPWQAKQFASWLEQERVTLTSLVPTQIYDLVQLTVQAPASLRAVIVGGAALSPELYHQARSLGWPLLPSYGMTEACSQVATAPLDSATLKILNHIKVRADKNGILSIKSSALLTGFAQARAGEDRWCEPLNDGWYQTSDRGEVNGDSLSVLGREQDFIKILGEGVHLGQLRSRLQGVAKSCGADEQRLAILALHDERRSGKLMLIAESAVAADLVTQIWQKFNAEVAPYEKLQGVCQLPHFPRSDLGKILWMALQEQVDRALGR